jgi:hypothetical protein
MLEESLLNYEVDEDDYICGNRFINESNTDNIVFCKTDYIPEYKGKIVDTFITHNSDYHITKEVYDFGPRARTWFCQNKDFNNDNLISLPIGLENFEPVFNAQSQFGRYSTLPQNGFSKKEYIIELSAQKQEHDKLVYLNINPTTYRSERNLVIDLFRDKSWVTFKSNLDWKEYYNDISRHKFVISPRGNGVDCHRTWESLYLRSIPIVLKSIHMNEFSDLPILLIDSWEQVTEDFLLTEYDKMINIRYNMSKLKMSYWSDVICR